MLVKDLIRNTEWTPGLGYNSSEKPKLSILLPTFCRGSSGLFKRCVDSILSQTLKELELIIIDDASTDGTAKQITAYLEMDSRVSCLRHPKNIGLPAISEYEAYLRARSERIAFAFDDNIFNNDAFEKLVRESEKTPHAMIYGHITYSWKTWNGSIASASLGSNLSPGILRLRNFIPNMGVLLPRHIIEEVGLFDPHIILARICDWDLWRRIAESYEVRYADIAVGFEAGPLTQDSLGNTYSLDHWAANEWMKQSSRNAQLKLSNFSEYNVLNYDAILSQHAQSTINSLAKKHASSRGWPLVQKPLLTNEEGNILVIILDYNASTYLYFGMLPTAIAARIRIITVEREEFEIEELVRATCVIFIRWIEPFKKWIEAAKIFGIPAYYFLDDNLPILAAENNPTFSVENFHLDRFREDLKQFEGVLLSSQILLTYFKENFLHQNLYHFPVAYASPLPISINCVQPKTEGEIVIAYAGGSHRAKNFWEILLPAFLNLSTDNDVRIHLLAPSFENPSYNNDLDLSGKLRISLLPFDPDYRFAMQRFARFQPDFLVTPPSETKNNRYKVLHPLLSASLMNAVAVLPHTEPYNQLTQCDNALLVKDPLLQASWYATLKALINGEYDLEQIKGANQKFCTLHYSGAINKAVLDSILKMHHGEISEHEQTRRVLKLTHWTRTQVNQKIEMEHNLNNALLHLSAYRSLLRYSWRHKILRKKTDLWASVPPSYEILKKSSKLHNWRRSGSSLELSDSLHNIDYREYKVTPRLAQMNTILFAVFSEYNQSGQIGIEVINPTKHLVERHVRNLSELSLQEPVPFNISTQQIVPGELWLIRIFAKTSAPIYVYEFINRRFIGLKFTTPTPFMAFVHN